MAFLFNVRFPTEPGLLEPLRDLAGRVAQYAGYREPDARQIAVAIGDSAAAAFAQLPAGAADLEIQFHTSDGTFEVTLVIAGAMATPPAAFSCVREGSRTICRLTRKLPDAFVD